MTNHLPQYVIAERYVGTVWPIYGEEGDRIATARRHYELGLCEIATRREGRMEYLYSIPRKKQGVLRPDYFTKVY